MQPQVRRLAGLRRYAMVGSIVAVLVGLLGMHVLGLHGIQHDAVPGAEAVGSVHHHAPDAGSVGAHFLASPEVQASAECCDHGHGMGPLMLCLALLIASGILLILVWHVRATALVPRLRFHFRTLWKRTHARAGPPYLIAYSVIRC